MICFGILYVNRFLDDCCSELVQTAAELIWNGPSTLLGHFWGKTISTEMQHKTGHKDMPGFVVFEHVFYMFRVSWKILIILSNIA